MTTADGKYATLDFGGVGTGFSVWGNYWNISKINITNTADGAKGMQLAGSYCVLEQMNFYTTATPACRSPACPLITRLCGPATTPSRTAPP